jgi:hypothetical protein
LKDAIRTIRDLKWTLENGNEDIYDDLKDVIFCNLEKLMILIEANIKNNKEDMEQAFKQIAEI